MKRHLRREGWQALSAVWAAAVVVTWTWLAYMAWHDPRTYTGERGGWLGPCVLFMFPVLATGIMLHDATQKCTRPRLRMVKRIVSDHNGSTTTYVVEKGTAFFWGWWWENVLEDDCATEEVALKYLTAHAARVDEQYKVVAEYREVLREVR
jgi:hypothetical protein